jgi:hypothetical protein
MLAVMHSEKPIGLPNHGRTSSSTVFYRKTLRSKPLILFRRWIGDVIVSRVYSALV